jgi:hypothetical protein
MKEITNSLVIFICLINFLLGCGIKNKTNEELNSSEDREEINPFDGSNIQGHYQAKFITLNPHINGTIPGSANFYRKDETFYAFVRLFAGGIKAWHMQNVYTGNRCPAVSDDTNQDGFIDIKEAEVVLGKIIIPLDSDISTQSSGKNFFPMADMSGNYQYERVTNFKRFLKDLQSKDNDSNDDVVKLPSNQGLNLIGKTVMIQGISETVELPETVFTKGRHPSFKTLPVVCGIFEKIEQIPGVPYILDEIPGPVGDVADNEDPPFENMNP